MTAQLFKYKVCRLSSATMEPWVVWIFTISCMDIMRPAHSVEVWIAQYSTVLLILTMLLLLYVISILTLHNQNIDFANVKISNRCPYDLRLSCRFVVNTLLNLSRRGSNVRLYKSTVRSVRRCKVDWIDQAHSRPQSLRSFWPAAGIESSESNHFEITKEITEFCPSGLT